MLLTELESYQFLIRKDDGTVELPEAVIFRLPGAILPSVQIPSLVQYAIVPPSSFGRHCAAGKGKWGRTSRMKKAKTEDSTVVEERRCELDTEQQSSEHYSTFTGESCGMTGVELEIKQPQAVGGATLELPVGEFTWSELNHLLQELNPNDITTMENLPDAEAYVICNRE